MRFAGVLEEEKENKPQKLSPSKLDITFLDKNRSMALQHFLEKNLFREIFLFFCDSFDLVLFFARSDVLYASLTLFLPMFMPPMLMFFPYL